MTRDAETTARNRYVMLNLMRLSGALFTMAGFIMIAGKYPLFGGTADRIFGVTLVLVGLFDFAIFPRLLARRWKSTSER